MGCCCLCCIMSFPVETWAYFHAVHLSKRLLFSCGTDNNSPPNTRLPVLSFEQKRAECGNVAAASPTRKAIDVTAQEAPEVALKRSEV